MIDERQLTVVDKLYPFQLEDVRKLEDQTGVLIANDMGTGKTPEALARDFLLRQRHPGAFKTLIVAPMTVLPAWELHLDQFCPSLYYVTVNPKDREGSWRLFRRTGSDVLLTHWDALRLMPWLQSIIWDHVIGDEIHRAKNRKAQQTRYFKAIKAKYKTGLSGTPATNQPQDLWSILNWLYPQDKYFKSYWRFYNTHVDFKIKYPEGYHQIVGPKDEDILLNKIRPFYARRRKKDVLPDLPDKYYTQIPVILGQQQRKPYDDMRREMLAWVGEHQDQPLEAPVVIARMIRLQQLADAYASLSEKLVNKKDKETGEVTQVMKTIVTLTEPSAKLDAWQEKVEEAPDKSLVVFTTFKGMVHLVCQRLDKMGISYVTLTGDTPNDERGQAVASFQDGTARVFVGTIQAGGIGITLTRADTADFLDRTWSPALNQQAEDRLHRIGQKNAVEIRDYVARDTVDLGRLQRLEMKWDWIKRLLGGSFLVGNK